MGQKENTGLIENSDKKLSRGRRLIFSMISILLPFFLLFLVEILLRISGFGYDFSLFVENAENKQFYSMNQKVGIKYFTIEDNATTGNIELFRKQKADNSVRIFILGASTALGWPYNHNGSFHRMLQYRLQLAFPNKDFEIINTSLTAVCSYTLYDFAKQLKPYQPDAVLIYAGHNEYYGALGVGSSSKLGSNVAFVRLLMNLRELRIVQAFSRLINSFRSKESVSLNRNENLMRRMTEESKIAFKSVIYEAGIEQYQRNLSDLLTCLRKENIPVFISTLVSNERDQRPMESGFLNEKDSAQLYKLFLKAETEYKSGNFDVVAQSLEELNKKDCGYAMSYYYLGQIAYKKNDFLKAKKYFFLAKEYDMLRFRAPEAINKIILDESKSKGCTLVDSKKAFENYSPNSIVDSTLILEHLHPNLKGYSIIADMFYKAILENGIISEKPEGRDSSFSWQQMPLTNFDTLYGKISILLLKEKWPFYEKMPAENPKRVKSYEEQIAGSFAVQQIKWAEAMNMLYANYINKKQYEPAFLIIKGLILEYPTNYNFIFEAGKLSENLNLTETAMNYFQQAFKSNPDENNAKKLMINLLKLDKPLEAMKYIDFLMKKNSGTDFKPMKNAVEQLIILQKELAINLSDVQLLNQIALIYAQIGNFQIAEKYINQILEISPLNAEAIKLKEDLRKR